MMKNEGATITAINTDSASDLDLKRIPGDELSVTVSGHTLGSRDVTTAIVEDVWGNTAHGVAVRNPADEPDWQLGVNLAVGRALAVLGELLVANEMVRW